MNSRHSVPLEESFDRDNCYGFIFEGWKYVYKFCVSIIEFRLVLIFHIQIYPLSCIFN